MKQLTKDTQMKNNLGKVLLLFSLLFSSVFANDLATYTLKTNKTKVFPKEAVLITFDAWQKNHTDNMMFLLKAQKNTAYKIFLLNKKIDDQKYHDNHTTYTYILFPLQAGLLSVGFDFTIQTASDKAVAQSYIDGHDDSVAIQTIDTHIALAPLEIQVENFNRKVDLVGDFTLTSNISKRKINQYESANIIYTLKGKGYKDNSLKLLKPLQGVTLFSEINNVYSKLTKTGYEMQREYIYALSAKKSFTIPKVSLQAYSPTKHRYYMLEIPPYSIEVKAIDTTTLLDKNESPQNKPFIDFERFKQFLIYLIVFIIGYITALNTPKKIRKKLRFEDNDPLLKAKKPKELLYMLTSQYELQEMQEELRLLEDIVYNNNKQINFQKLKKQIIDKLQTRRIHK